LRVHQRVLGEAARAAAHDAHAPGERAHAFADLLHLAGAVHARGLSRADLAEELGAVQARGAHAHEQLARPGLGRGDVPRLQASARHAVVGSHGPILLARDADGYRPDG
jgi:hypothetical protein